MANKNIFETLTSYRLKVEKDGKNLVDVPSILALPGMLIAPKLSLAGLVAAPLLGMKVHLEDEKGQDVDVEGAVRGAVKTVKETAETAARTIQEEISKAWEEASAADPETEDVPENPESGEGAETESAEGAEAEGAKGAEPEGAPKASWSPEIVDSQAEPEVTKETIQDIVEDLERKEKEEDVPTIRVNPEDSAEK